MPRSFQHGGKTVTERDVKCGECGAPMVLRITERFRWKNGVAQLFYGCSRYPKCRACHGAHPDGEPLGVPGDAATKAARIEAHDWLDKVQLSRGWAQKPGERHAGTYYWLAMKMHIPKKDVRDRCHIGKFDIEQCMQVVQICKDALERDKVREAAKNEATAQL